MDTVSSLEKAVITLPHHYALRALLIAEYMRKRNEPRETAAYRTDRLRFDSIDCRELDTVRFLMELGSPVRAALIHFCNVHVGKPDAQRGGYDLVRGSEPPRLYPRRPAHMPEEADVWVCVGAGWLLRELQERNDDNG